MAEGPRLPRKATFLKRVNESLAGVAYQIGVLLAIQRNRCDITQWELAEELGIAQEDVSALENGEHVPLTNAQIDRLFSRLELPNAKAHANFVKWWRDNA